jgi:hypothetical protein
MKNSLHLTTWITRQPLNTENARYLEAEKSGIAVAEARNLSALLGGRYEE